MERSVSEINVGKKEQLLSDYRPNDHQQQTRKTFCETKSIAEEWSQKIIEFVNRRVIAVFLAR